MSPEKKKTFRNKIKNVDWTNVILNDFCQNAYTMFHNIILEIYYSSFPVKRKSLKPHYKTRKPKLYKEYRNNLTRLLRRTERTYYDILLIDNRNNLKKTWSIIKDIIKEKRFLN